MKKTYIFLLLSLLLGAPLRSWAQTLTTYQAEAGQLTSATVGTSWAGYTGSGFVEGMTGQGRSSLTYTVTVPTAGTYNLDTRYATGVDATYTRKLSVLVNGARVLQALFPGTGAWDAWKTQTISVSLNAGTNTVRYFYDYPDYGYLNLDYLVVRSAPYEAATAQLTSASAASSSAGYTGSGYAANITTAGASAVTFSVNAPAAGPYGLKVRYAAGGSNERYLSVYVNGTDVAQAGFPSTTSWSKWDEQATVVSLRAGVNTISYRYDSDDSGWLDLDYLQVVPLAALATNNWQSANNDFSVRVDSLTQRLDRSRVPTGILYDRVLPLALLQEFGLGAQPDTVTADYVYQAYLELSTAAYTPASFRFPSQQFRERGQQFLRRDSVALGVLDYSFNYLDTLAVYDNLLLEARRLHYAVAGAPRSPYLTGAVTMAAALADTIRSGTTFYVPTELLLGNRSRQVSSLLVDFANGAGPKTCSPGQPQAIYYPSGGRKVITYTVLFNDGTQQQCRSVLYVRPSVALRNSVPLPLTNIRADESFAGYDGSEALFGAGEVKVVLHNALSIDEYNANPTAYRLRKPLIVLDGFDAQDASGLKFIEYPESFYKLVQGAGIFEVANQQERDVILLNFPNSQRRRPDGTLTNYSVDGGTDYIERNALVLVALLNQLKPRLASANEKFAIIGPSMGGLISRYALAYMEKRQQALSDAGLPAEARWDHNTALWISLDAPHQGANVPIGTQEFLRFFQNYQEKAKVKFNQSVNSVAAKQMLVHHHLGAAGAYSLLGAAGFRDRFMLALRENGRRGSLGYPELLRRVAIANGRLDGGRQEAGTPCGTALQMDKRVGILKFTISKPLFFYRSVKRGTVAIADINFSPTNTTCRVFKGEVAWEARASKSAGGPLRRFTDTRSTIASYDLAPGGWYDALWQVAEAAADKSTTFKNVIPNHCFIPTVSALAFQYRSMASYQSTASLPDPMTVLLGRNLSCADETPFDAYYGPANRNVQHVEGSDDGTRMFLGRELAGISQTPVFSSAAPSMCPNSSATFTIPASCGRLPITYTWTLSGNLRFGNGQTTASGVALTSQTIYSTSSTGGGQVTVVASQQGLAPSAPLVYSVNVSAPEATGTYSCLGCSSGSVPLITVNDVPEGRVTLNITSPGSTDFNFSVSSTAFTIVKTGARSAYFDMGPYSNTQKQGVTVTITPTNGCTGPSYRVFRRPSSYGFTYAPNPASDELTVTAIDTGQPVTGPASMTAPPFEAELYDGRGKKVKSAKSNQGKAKLDVRDLPTGLYHLRAGKDKEAISEHIQVVH